MKPEPPPMPKTAAFGALQKHDADKREDDHQMDDNKHGLHEQFRFLSTQRRKTPARQIPGPFTREQCALEGRCRIRV